MAIQTILSVAISGLQAQSARAAEIADNVANVNTGGFNPSDILTISVQAGDRGAGVQARRRESGGQGDSGDLTRQFANLIETEIAYKANARVVATASRTLGQFLDTVA